MKRLFVKRDELIHFDSVCVDNDALLRHYKTQNSTGRNDIESLIKLHEAKGYKLRCIGAKDSYRDLLVKVVSMKGNTSMELVAYPIEIENTGNVYYLLHTPRKLRARDKVYVGDKECIATPVARLKYNGTLIYEIHDNEF